MSLELPQRALLSAQTAELLRREIVAGTFGGLLPGEVELSSLLKVSRVTLRAALEVLEKAGEVSSGQGRRRRVLKAAQPLRAKRKATTVIILSPVAMPQLNAFKLLWIDALRDELTPRGFEMQYLARSVVQRLRPGPALRQIVSGHPDAIWILLRASPGAQRWFAAEGIPAVVAGSHSPGIVLPSVDADYHASCRHAAGRLVARGCERLGLLIPQPMLTGDRESEAGFREGAGRHPVSAAHHDGTPDGLCRVLDAMMTAHPPQGLLVFQATHAVTALTRLLDTGWRVPRDIKLISRDDDPFLAHLTPEPARYKVAPHAFAGRLAAVIRQFRDGATPAPVAERLLPEFLDGTTL